MSDTNCQPNTCQLCEGTMGNHAINCPRSIPNLESQLAAVHRELEMYKLDRDHWASQAKDDLKKRKHTEKQLALARKGLIADGENRIKNIFVNIMAIGV